MLPVLFGQYSGLGLSAISSGAVLVSLKVMQHDARYSSGDSGLPVDHGTAMASKERTSKRKQVNAEQPPYTSRIIKAGALLPDTKTLLAHWNLDATVPENLKQIQRENIFGKASRTRVEDILRIFRQRYLGEEAVVRSLVVLVKHRFPASALDRILYFHSAQSDPLLADTVLTILGPLKRKGIADVDVDDLHHELSRWVREGRTTKEWGDYTVRRVSQGLLATLRDFGVLEGAVKKRIAPTLLPVQAFAYIMFFLKQHQPSGAKLIDLPDWQLFFLESEGVERFLFEAHQNNLLEYHAAGNVTRLTFPAKTLEEYANVLAARAH